MSNHLMPKSWQHAVLQALGAERAPGVVTTIHEPGQDDSFICPKPLDIDLNDLEAAESVHLKYLKDLNESKDLYK